MEGEIYYFSKQLEEIKKEAPKCASVRDISGGDSNVMKQGVVEGLYILAIICDGSTICNDSDTLEQKGGWSGGSVTDYLFLPPVLAGQLDIEASLTYSKTCRFCLILIQNRK